MYPLRTVYTSEVTGIGSLRILEVIRSLNLKKKIKFYQATSSELFGEKKGKNIFNEKSELNPNLHMVLQSFLPTI